MDNDQYKIAKFTGEEFIKIGEIAKPFWARGASENPPKFVIFMGGVGVGKTTIRREKYKNGYVHLDFGEVNLAIEKAVGKNHPRLAEYALFASDMILRESINEKKNIVIEIIGDNYDLIVPVIEKMKDIGYKLDIVGLTGDIAECRQRHLKAVEKDSDYISAYFTQGPTLSVFYNQLELGEMPKAGS
ncbi:MAG: hypothetical protein AAB480_00655 [Patescibacteria group bacterium]